MEVREGGGGDRGQKEKNLKTPQYGWGDCRKSEFPIQNRGIKPNSRRFPKKRDLPMEDDFFKKRQKGPN